MIEGRGPASEETAPGNIELANSGPVQAAPPGARRLVLLGASNLARSFGSVVAAGQQVCGTPLEILTALGRGRSYGAEHSFLGRRLPGILDCGLWAALERSGGAVDALVTDVGNDIVYGRSAETIAGWVETCLARLQAAGARMVMTRLPVDNVRSISEARFLFFRRLFFPRFRISLADVQRQANELDERVADLGRRYGAAVVEQNAAWYGFDPIHIRWSIARAAWSEILGPLADRRSAPAPIPAGRLGHRDRYRLMRMRPALYKRGTRVYHAAQPAGALSTGAIVSLY